MNMAFVVKRIQVETTDVDFLHRLIDFLNTAPAKRSSTVVRVLDDEVRSGEDFPACLGHGAEGH